MKILSIVHTTLLWGDWKNNTIIYVKEKELNLEVIAIGKPDIFALSESEQKVFFTTLLDSIIKVKQEEENSKYNKSDIESPTE